MLVFPWVFRSFTKRKTHSSKTSGTTRLFSKTQVTLIGKRYTTEDNHQVCCLYFDTDGNMTTVEIMARQKTSYPYYQTQIRRLKFGQKKTLSEWNRELVCPTTLNGPQWLPMD